MPHEEPKTYLGGVQREFTCATCNIKVTDLEVMPPGWNELTMHRAGAPGWFLMVYLCSWNCALRYVNREINRAQATHDSDSSG